jgi:hypothetical protein
MIDSNVVARYPSIAKYFSKALRDNQPPAEIQRKYGEIVMRVRDFLSEESEWIDLRALGAFFQTYQKALIQRNFCDLLLHLTPWLKSPSASTSEARAAFDLNMNNFRQRLVVTPTLYFKIRVAFSTYISLLGAGLTSFKKQWQIDFAVNSKRKVLLS